MEERINLARLRERLHTDEWLTPQTRDDLLALADVAAAAYAYYEVDWHGESEDVLTSALARFDIQLPAKETT